MSNSHLLIEIGCEELPSSILATLNTTLFNHFVKIAKEAGVSVCNEQFYYTPRRLAFSCQISATLPDQNIDRQGPFLAHALQDGQPNAAGRGFASACGVDFSELEHIDTASGPRLSYRATKPGVKTQDKILEWLNQAHKKLAGFKMMRWHNYTVEFPRPVQWVMVCIDRQFLTGCFLTCQLSNTSNGHRFLHPNAVEINHAEHYLPAMLAAKVVVCPKKRKQIIKEKSAAILMPNQAIVEVSNLLDEVVGLVEWPVPLLCHFDPKFLALPDALLIEVMRVHQKCFPIKDVQTGQLLPMFITVSNIDSKSPDAVIEGNQRVMTARLSDASFFFEADKRVPLKHHVNALGSVTFQSALGSMLDKTLRLQNLAQHIAKTVRADAKIVSDIAGLAKADLCTETVGEFPDLHGVIGSALAEASGMSTAIVEGVSEQLHPRFSGDRLPSTIEACVVALADRLDTLIGLISAEFLPKGDRDPFGLRRAAMGVVRIIVENHFQVDIQHLIEQAQQGFGVELSNRDASIGILINFLYERFGVWWVNQGGEKGLFLALHDLPKNQLSLIYKRLQALQEFVMCSDSQLVIQCNKRVKNLLKKQANMNEKVNPKLFVIDVEHLLNQKIEMIEAEVIAHLKNGSFMEAMHALIPLAVSTDSFFDQCLIMDKDDAIRNNRLILLRNVGQLFATVADFSVLSAQ